MQLTENSKDATENAISVKINLDTMKGQMVNTN